MVEQDDKRLSSGRHHAPTRSGRRAARDADHASDVRHSNHGTLLRHQALLAAALWGVGLRLEMILGRRALFPALLLAMTAVPPVVWNAARQAGSSTVMGAACQCKAGEQAGNTHAETMGCAVRAWRVASMCAVGSRDCWVLIKQRAATHATRTLQHAADGGGVLQACFQLCLAVH